MSYAAFSGGSNGRARALPVFARMSRSVNPFELPPSFDSGCVGARISAMYAAYFTGRKKPRTPADLAAHSRIRTRFASGGLCKWNFAKNGNAHWADPAGRMENAAFHKRRSPTSQHRGADSLNPSRF